MNPWDLSASDLLVWGMVLHLVGDWPLQNDWMANNKMKRRIRRGPDNVVIPSPRWDRSPAAYVHAGIHGLLLALIFGWVAVPLAVVHMLIDMRTPVVWWSTKIRQTQPSGRIIPISTARNDFVPVYDVGTEVRFWTDQVFHIVCIAVAALLVS